MNREEAVKHLRDSILLLITAHSKNIVGQNALNQYLLKCIDFIDLSHDYTEMYIISRSILRLISTKYCIMYPEPGSDKMTSSEILKIFADESTFDYDKYLEYYKNTRKFLVSNLIGAKQ